MARLEDLQQGAHVRGLDRSGVATVEAVSWVGEQAVKVIYRSASGALKDRLVYRDDEPTLELAAPTRQWSFDGYGDLLRLVSEANRIQLAWLFDPFVAVSSSLIRPLPHQISAVYGEMLPRQPLRFLLADDPGAGKTISAGLLIRELMVRGDLERCSPADGPCPADQLLRLKEARRGADRVGRRPDRRGGAAAPVDAARRAGRGSDRDRGSGAQGHSGRGAARGRGECALAEVRLVRVLMILLTATPPNWRLVSRVPITSWHPSTVER